MSVDPRSQPKRQVGVRLRWRLHVRMLVLVSALIVLVVLVSVGSLAWAVVTALVFGWLLGHSINIVVRPDRQRRTVQPDRLVRQWLR